MEETLKILKYFQMTKKKVIKSITTTNESNKINKYFDEKNFEDNLRRCSKIILNLLNMRIQY